MKHTVTVLPENRKLTADHGMSLYDLLILHGYYIPAACQGRGVCGKCKVTLISGTPTGTSPDEDGMLLSCRAYVTEDLVIRYTAQNATQTVFKEGATVTADIGAVLDIGTTTLAMRLYSLENGNLLGNPYHYRDERTNGMIELADKKRIIVHIFSMKLTFSRKTMQESLKK